MKYYFAFCILLLNVSTGLVEASPLAAGASVGAEFPFAHNRDGHTQFGVSAEAYYRLDPYEVRFHFADLDSHFYVVQLGIKHHFTNDLIRPFVEAALGPLIVDVAGPYDLAYGFSPTGSIGADLAINENLSTGVVARYSGYIYFGDTLSGNFEANHSLAILANVTVWF